MDYTIHYSTITDTTFVEGSDLGDINGSPEVIIVNAPGASQRISIKTITFYNDNDSNKTIIVNLKNSTTYITICEVNLSSYDSLIYDDNINLNATTESLVAHVSATAGYLAGGTTGAIVATADKLVYTTETTAAQSSANLSQARFSLAGVNNSDLAGYFCGGATTLAGAAVATTDKLVYSTDTTAAQSSANLSQARYRPMGVSNANTAGYIAGGFTGAYVVTADKLTYSTDVTSAQSSANLSQARGDGGSASNHNFAGYFAGGGTGATIVATADKLTYSNDTTAAQSSANLSQARRALSGVGNKAVSGYFAGGETGGVDAGAARVATADKLTFSNDTTAAQSSANLSQARFNLGSCSNNFEFGFFAGGTTGGNVSTADKVVYSNDITAAQSSANISQARYYLTGVDG